MTTTKAIAVTAIWGSAAFMAYCAPIFVFFIGAFAAYATNLICDA